MFHTYQPSTISQFDLNKQTKKNSFDQHSKQKTRKENGMSRIKFKKCEKWCSLNVCEIVHRSDRMGGGSFIFTEHPTHADNNNNNNNHKMVEMCYVMYSSMRHKHVSTLSLFIWRFRTKYEIKKIHTQTHDKQTYWNDNDDNDDNGDERKRENKSSDADKNSIQLWLWL